VTDAELHRKHEELERAVRAGDTGTAFALVGVLKQEHDARGYARGLAEGRAQAPAEAPAPGDAPEGGAADEEAPPGDEEAGPEGDPEAVGEEEEPAPRRGKK
jgi:hypothetical protein